LSLTVFSFLFYFGAYTWSSVSSLPDPNSPSSHSSLLVLNIPWHPDLLDPSVILQTVNSHELLLLFVPPRIDLLLLSLDSLHPLPHLHLVPLMYPHLVLHLSLHVCLHLVFPLPQYILRRLILILIIRCLFRLPLQPLLAWQQLNSMMPVRRQVVNVPCALVLTGRCLGPPPPPLPPTKTSICARFGRWLPFRYHLHLFHLPK